MNKYLVIFDKMTNSSGIGDDTYFEEWESFRAPFDTKQKAKEFSKKLRNNPDYKNISVVLLIPD